MRRLCMGVVLAVVLGASAGPAVGERLALRRYGQDDGLAGDQVRELFEDSRGYLWIGTGSGLSRFDGERFVSYGPADGLPPAGVTRVLEDSLGRLWVGTGRGLALMLPTRDVDGRLFRVFTFGNDELDIAVAALHEDPRGGLWVAIGERLFLLPAGATDQFAEVPLALSWRTDRTRELIDVASARDGSLWVVTTVGILRLAAGGGRALLHVEPPPDEPGVQRLMVDQAGRLWLLGRHVLVVVPAPFAERAEPPLLSQAQPIPSSLGALPTRPGAVAHLDRLPSGGYGMAIELRDGEVWIASTSGLDTLTPTGSRRLTEAEGLPSRLLSALLEDREGNLWIGTRGAGLVRLDRAGFESYGRTEGLASEAVTAILAPADGSLVAVGSPASRWLHLHLGKAFRAVGIPSPHPPSLAGWGWSQVTFVDSRGQWWVPTSAGLYRFPPVKAIEEMARARPLARYDSSNGLGADRVFRLFEDSRGDLWISTFGPVRISRWERMSERFHVIAALGGALEDSASAFAEGPDGSIWIGLYAGGLARWRGGRIERFGADLGLPPGMVTALLVDRRQGLWVGTTTGGLVRAADLAAARPQFAPPAPALDRAGTPIYTLVEDLAGRIYVGGARGIDRLDPAAGTVRHFDSANGLINNTVIAAVRDARGDLWFGTHGGVSRLHPRPDSLSRPPRLLVTEMRFGGRQLPVAELGIEEVPPLTVPAGFQEIEIGYAAVDLLAGPSLRYQTALDRSDSGSWDPPSRERRVHLVGLGPGQHTLRVRAVRSDGTTSAPVVVRLDVTPPLWRRAWFLALVGLALFGSVGLAVFARWRRLLALQRVRERISADLHDELGLSLARISMLSEVARRRASPAAEEELEEIGETARELIDATSAMAWALDPRRDDLGSLLTRLRRVGADVFSSAGVSWQLVAPEGCDSVALPAEARRHLYLVLEEALHNAARHARASAVGLSISIADDWLTAEVRDDGLGFSPAEAAGRSGSGLLNMARRAEALGGELAVDSEPGRGTTVRLRAPLRRSRRQR